MTADARPEREHSLRHFVVLMGAGIVTLASAAPGLTQDPAAVNPKTVHVTLENERVRVLEAVLQPGEKEQLHSHPDCIIRVVRGGKVRTHGAEGTTTDTDLVAGATIYRPAVTHWTENVGTTPVELVIVELKTPAPAKAPHGRLDDPFLQNLVGDWTIERKIRGQVVENTLHVEWVLHHQFVQLHMRDTKQPPEYEALVLVGFDPSTSRYVAQWCDDFGGQYSAIGYGKRQGDSVELTFTYADGPFHNTFTWHPATASWTFLMEAEKKDGTRTVFAEDTARRRER
jgi:quercetin dioxygenase-like cupin family protein